VATGFEMLAHPKFLQIPLKTECRTLPSADCPSALAR
jgi:hypothetical protein